MPDIFTPPAKINTLQEISPIQETTAPLQAVPHSNEALVQKTINAPITEGKPLGLLSSFHLNPKGITFQNQEDDENIVLFIRRHFIINIPWIIGTTLLLFLPPVIVWLLRFSGLELFTITPQLFFILMAFYYLVVFSYALMRFIIWFYHVGIVTPKRLLDLDVYNILSHHLAETEIADIVDVSYSQNGFFQSFFNYGDVPIQTEAIKANFEFEASPKPALVSDIITDLRPKRSSR